MVFSHSQVYGGAVRALPECVVGVQMVREAIWALPGDHPRRWCSVRVLCRVFGVWRVGLLSLIYISEPTRLGMISYSVFFLKQKKRMNKCSHLFHLHKAGLYLYLH